MSCLRLCLSCFDRLRLDWQLSWRESAFNEHAGKQREQHGTSRCESKCDCNAHKERAECGARECTQASTNKWGPIRKDHCLNHSPNHPTQKRAGEGSNKRKQSSAAQDQHASNDGKDEENKRRHDYSIGQSWRCTLPLFLEPTLGSVDSASFARPRAARIER
jgi:hypothetical protein